MKLDSVDKLVENIKEGLEREAEMKRKGEISTKVYDELSKNVGDFEVPPTVLEGEIDKEIRRIAQTEVKSEEDAEAFKKDMDKHRKEAEKAAIEKLRRMFILRKIAKLEDINVEQHEIDGQIKGMSQYYGYKENELRAMMEKSGGMEEMHLEILTAKVSEFLADNAKAKAAKKAAKKETAAEDK
jgi:FKBP-type peptidyl-prolyl cis-trans isomerase (trigger factor)